MKALRIYLADPVHNFVQSRDIWTIPLNVLTIASYTKAAFCDQVEIRIFKFPDLIFKAIKENPPDIIGTSNYIWNCELSKTILKFSKEQNKNTITVMGGPNVTQTQLRMTQLLKEAHCDYYIAGSGEHPFKCLVGTILKAKGFDVSFYKDLDIHSIWFLDTRTKLAVFRPALYTLENLDEIPSPFQNGMVNEFFEHGLIPMIETHRGCPFSCTYCDWGDATHGQLYCYSIERVKSDIDYCRRHAKDERLMIDDANFGLMGKRDMEIAKFVKHIRDVYGWPGKVIITWGQTKSDTMLQISDVFKDLCMMTQSSQSMNQDVLKNIKRRNIPATQWEKSVNFCRERGIHIYGELMIPLPGETMESYISAMRYLFKLGVDFINTNPLIMLEGAEMNTKKEREKYQMVTKWRLLENCYGIYDCRKIVEYQEMVVQTSTFSIEEYYLSRRLSWLVQMSWNLRKHALLLRLLLSFGVNPVDFLLNAIMKCEKAPPPVKALFESFLHDTCQELFPTLESLILFYSTDNQFEFLRWGGFRKLNTYYTSRVSIECNNAFLYYYKSLAKEMASESSCVPTDYNDMICDCARFVQQWHLTDEEIFKLELGVNIDKEGTFYYDFVRWDYDANGKPLEDYLQRFSGISREYQLRKLYEPYHGIHRKHLLFNIRQIP